MTKDCWFLLFNKNGDKMRVKVFVCDQESDLESAINDFIQEKEVVDIKFSVAASVFGEEQVYCFSALIVYK